jgi:hypothetical protein
VNEIDFRIFGIKNKYQFVYCLGMFRLNNERLIANRDGYMHDNMMIVEGILDNRESLSTDVSWNNDEELIIKNVFDHHDLLLLIVQDV